MLKSIGKFFADTFGQQAGTGNVFHPTEKCPDCGSKLFKMDSAGWGERPREPLETHDGSPGVSPHQDDVWHCPNLDCPAQIRARIEHWCSPGAMDIPCDAAFVAVLVSKGLVRDVAELYRLKQGEIAALPGMDKDSAKKFFDAITASRKREAWRVLFGLSIPHLGVEESKSLCRYFGDVGNVLDANVERLMKADGISEAVARCIVQWHNDSVNAKTVKRLYKSGVNFKEKL